MKSYLFSAVVFAVLSLVLTPPSQADDLKALEGKWTVESVEMDGKKLDSAELIKELEVTITGDHYAMVTEDGPDGGTLKLDETQNPKTIDATDTEGLDVGQVFKGIYELSGDTMRVCYAIDGSERPTEFATMDGASLVIIIYQREK